MPRGGSPPRPGGLYDALEKHYRGGCLSQNNLRRRPSRKLRLTVFAALVAVVAAIAVPVAANADMRNGVVQLLSPITQLFAGDNGAQKRAIDGASTVDPDTTNAWSAIAVNSDSTENIGRIWTDKSVFSGNYDFEGALEGRIARTRSGNGGFGYDPVFIPDEYPDRTLADITEEEKNAISHRGKALRAMADWLAARTA